MIMLRTAWHKAFGQSQQVKANGLPSLKGWLFLMAFVLSLVPMTVPTAYAAFEDIGTGARPTAMGGAYVSAGDDSLSLFYNPAGLAQLHQKEISSEYSKLFSGLSDGSNLSQTYLGYAQPVRWGGTLAVGWKQFALDDLYKERTLALGYGEWLTPRIAIGGALKQLHHSFGVENIIVDDSGNIRSGTPSFFAQNGNSSTAYSADLGMLYRWSDRHTVGISVQDVNEPNVALSPSDHEIVSRTLRMGMTYKATRNLNLSGAMTTRESLSNQRDTTWTGAAEKWWDLEDESAVIARGSLSSGSREFQQMALGAGYRISSIQLDYAFIFNLTGVTLGKTLGTHRLSFSYRFGTLTGETHRKPEIKSKRKTPPAWYEPQPVRKAPVKRALPRAVELEISPEEIDMPSGTGNRLPRLPVPTVAPTPAAPMSVDDITVSVVFDSDYDGVPDELDRCADTPAGLEVDERGCAPDSDGDGVEDYRDYCPNTAQGRAVSKNGCPLPRKVNIEFIPLEEIGNGVF